MAKSNATLKINWTIGLIYAAVILVLAAIAIYAGLYYAMPYELVVYDSMDQAVSVLFTDDFYNSSMELMMVTVIFPAAAYLFMYYRYAKKVGERPHEKEAVKKSGVWVMPFILLLVVLVVWCIVSVLMISLGLGLDSNLFADAVMLRQFFLVYGIAAVMEIVLYMVGKFLFKPSIVQRA